MLNFFMCLSGLWIDGYVYTVLFLIVCVSHYVGSHLVDKKINSGKAMYYFKSIRVLTRVSDAVLFET